MNRPVNLNPSPASLEVAKITHPRRGTGPANAFRIEYMMFIPHSGEARNG